MGYPGRFTACLSTQAGCAMGCLFCATGQSGFRRHLRVGEIVAQAVQAQRVMRGGGDAGVRNLVLMGMGEPLHNYDAVMAALEIITDTRGLNLGPGRISISTVGVVPGIRRMAEERRPYNLAVSLHGATEAERAALVPVSRRWPLDELIDACRFYGETTGRRIFFEWALIAGTNDSPATARRLASLLEGLNAHVNLIPLNRTDGFAGLPSTAESSRYFSGDPAGRRLPMHGPPAPGDRRRRRLRPAQRLPILRNPTFEVIGMAARMRNGNHDCLMLVGDEGDVVWKSREVDAPIACRTQSPEQRMLNNRAQALSTSERNRAPRPSERAS